MHTSVKLFQLLGKLGFDPKKSIVIVHGDTITSTLAAFIAFASKYKVAHIEAGLRSRNLLNPFPEEIDRILTSFVASVHFAPGAEATKNLTSRARNSEVIDTHRNTVVDSQLEIQKIKPSGLILPDEFALVCLHRSELLSNKSVLNQTMRTLDSISQRVHVVMVVDPLTESNLKSQESYINLENSRYVTVVRKLIYPEFQYLLQNCEFLITDSGGQQEEAAQLGIPCIVHRRATERVEGIGENVILSYWNQDNLIRFSNDYRSYIRPIGGKLVSPSDIIVTRLRRKNHE
jgi:UDP-N-acetylglucosamine 2-epimerase (non-hydrolysing)